MKKPYVIHKDDRDSIQMGSNVKITYLRKSEGEYSILVHMKSGGSFPMHEHVGGEEIFVVEGTVQIGELELTQGDYFYSPPGYCEEAKANHECTMLISSAKGLQTSLTK
ncbi:cupin domain-containing protein [Hazenella sp. IB182357]|uniref:Cupin domain-containing protein n=1 Tax=Polycladospora coralii TaxID=2771432 RepID=A0A926NCA8_9BACL|nr:cupin domain-containing protein [Polycladospora coralii]MBD1370959.1 cupin domain-containing protein [Polycladospora coralii]MBS7529898.1 cupin domain-containing protein [Polycladospora coralii]